MRWVTAEEGSGQDDATRAQKVVCGQWSRLQDADGTDRLWSFLQTVCPTLTDFIQLTRQWDAMALQFWQALKTASFLQGTKNTTMVLAK